MAAPIMHLLLAFNVLSLLPDKLNKQDFMIGTMFPDIRYLAGLKREETHIENIGWKDVIDCKSSFKAGMLFHNIVDIIRINKFLSIFDVHNKTVEEHKLYSLTHKLAEDAVVYDQLNQDHLEDIETAFNAISMEELDFCPNKQIVIKWHKMIQEYCRQPLSLNSIHNFLSDSRGQTLKNNKEFDAEKLFLELINSKSFRKKVINFLLEKEKFNTPQKAFDFINPNFLKKLNGDSYGQPYNQTL